MNPEDVLIVGYGSPLNGDDAVGPRAARILARRGFRAIAGAVEVTHHHRVETWIECVDARYHATGAQPAARIDTTAVGAQPACRLLARFADTVEEMRPALRPERKDKT